jgi:hypothetical protein
MERTMGSNLIDGDLVHCAQINFENLERAWPDVAQHPYYRIAKAQLDEALGGMPVEERFALDVKRAESREEAAK